MAYCLNIIYTVGHFHPLLYFDDPLENIDRFLSLSAANLVFISESVLDIYGSFCPGPCVCLTFVAHFWDNGNNTFVVSFDCAEFENFTAWKSQPGAPFIKLLFKRRASEDPGA